MFTNMQLGEVLFYFTKNACQYIQKNIFLPYFKVNYEITYKEVFQSYLRGSSSVNCIYFKFKLKYIFIL